MTSFTDLNSVAHIDESSSMKRTEQNKTEWKTQIWAEAAYIVYMNLCT